MNNEQIAAARAPVDAATQGRAVQFHPHYCPEAKCAKVEDWDTSHDLSVIRDDGSRYKIGSFRHAADAMFDQWCRHKVPAILDALAAAEARAADLTAKLEAWIGVYDNCEIATHVCCCGDDMDRHAEPMGCGHVATDHGGYTAGKLAEETRAALKAGGAA